ncbi:MAG: hypothetical protein K9K64_17370 [Desulfohalobiaceae bacterium]|nr:hypothetical protein [Desulfohalobiaceae bacterium]MCF8107250.1 hypothetical protein [Desulfohalobiaceae bacterium]
MKNILQKIENMLLAATFAEANAPEIAREYLGPEKRQNEAVRGQLQGFLEDIGLQHVPVTYGIARL